MIEHGLERPSAMSCVYNKTSRAYTRIVDNFGSILRNIKCLISHCRSTRFGIRLSSIQLMRRLRGALAELADNVASDRANAVISHLKHLNAARGCSCVHPVLALAARARFHCRGTANEK
jgi:hypothetical protein